MIYQKRLPEVSGGSRSSINLKSKFLSTSDFLNHLSLLRPNERAESSMSITELGANQFIRM